MQNGKIDNQLLLAVELPQEEREQTESLNVGYLPGEELWELVVKSSSDLMQEAGGLGIRSAVRLLNGYTVITIPERSIAALSGLAQVEYIEKPKRLYFEIAAGSAASCFLPLKRADSFTGGPLTGEGVIMAVIDSGIDYSHPEFRREDGSTRLLGLWDMTLSLEEDTPPPEGYVNGRYFDAERINRALRAESREERLRLVPSTDVSGHGTAVAGIACGNAGTASGSDILAVKLGGREAEARSTALMMAVDFCVRTAQQRVQPLVINLSYGNNYGAHNGASLQERYLQSVADVWKNALVIGAGNEGASGHHASGNFAPGSDTPQTAEWVVGTGETGISLQLWLSYSDEAEVYLTGPSGSSYGPLRGAAEAQVFFLDNTKIYFYLGEPKPFNAYREYFFEFIPGNGEITPGIWRIRIEPVSIRDGRFDLWLPTDAAVGENVRFLRPDPDTTLTIPSTVSSAVTVGAYDTANDSVAYFSGRGYLPGNCSIKPDLVAPGVNILTAAPGGGYTRKSGTSFAAPFVSGACALLMQWGIIWGNDNFLYGEKLKAYLIKGARRLDGITDYPDPRAGWGALCVSDALPQR